MEYDHDLWLEMLKDAPNLDINTRIVLLQYSTHFDAKGHAPNLPKQLARATGFPLKNVRKSLALAKENGWLEIIDTDEGRAFRATWPEHVL